MLALDSAPQSVAVAVAPPPGFLAQVHSNLNPVPVPVPVPGAKFKLLCLQLEQEQGAGIGQAVGVATGGKKKGKKSTELAQGWIIIRCLRKPIIAIDIWGRKSWLN